MPDAKPKHDISGRSRRVWERLQDWYGTRLAETYGPWPPKDWCDVIDKTDNDTVKRGLSIIRSEYLNFPPTFPQFCAAMKPPVRAANTATSTVELLTRFVTKTAWNQLTNKQRSLPWKFIHAERSVVDERGRDSRVCECVAVEIPQRDGEQGYRFTVADMMAREAA